MRKRFMVFFMTVVMCVTLVACGGVDQQPAVDAFNSASTAYDNLVDKMSADIESYDQELIDVMNEMAETMKVYKEALESGEEFTEEEITEMVGIFTEVEQWAVETEGQLEELKIPIVDKQPAIDAFNATSTAFDALANEINANPEIYPQELVDVMVQMSDALTQCKTLLESDKELNQEDVDTLVAQLADIEAWVAEAETVLEEAVNAATEAAVNMQPAIDAFNSVVDMYDATATVVNENSDAYEQEFIDTLAEIGEVMVQYKELLESDQALTEEQVNLMVEDLTAIGQWLQEIESDVFG